MASIACPHCQARTFSWWDKYLTSKWAIRYCPACGGRVCAQPIILTLLYFLYVWDVMLFGYLGVIDSKLYFVVMIVIWLILDFFSLYVPLSALKAKPKPGS